MSTPLKTGSLQSHQIFLYGRAIHPELLPIKARKVLRQGGYELEIWAMDGGHLLRFEHTTLCACELMTAQETRLPEQGLVAGFLAMGERDFEHRFAKDKVVYMNTIQTESLSENLFLSTYDEIVDYARTTDALVHRWADEAGKCLTIIDTQSFNKEIHAQCYHLVAQGGLVIRTQTIFEHA
jgi:hypothetical protein